MSDSLTVPIIVSSPSENDFEEKQQDAEQKPLLECRSSECVVTVTAGQCTTYPKSPKLEQLPPLPPKQIARTASGLRRSSVALLCLAVFAVTLFAADQRAHYILAVTAPFVKAYDTHAHYLPWVPRRFRASLHKPPGQPLRREDMSIREPLDQHVLTMIILHDLGYDHEELPLHHHLAAEFPWIKFVHPQGRTINVTIYQDDRSGWYDVRDAEDLHLNEDETGMVESQRQINQVIREEREILTEAGKEPRIVLAGFSQGAAMALLATLTAIEPIEALIMYSGYLAMPTRLRRLGGLVQSTTPTFWGHGRDDPDIDVENAAADVRALRQYYSMSALRFRTYNMKHYWSLTELDDTLSWLEDTLHKTRPVKAVKGVHAEARKPHA